MPAAKMATFHLGCKSVQGLYGRINQKAKEALLAELYSQQYPPSLSPDEPGRLMTRPTLRTTGLHVTVLQWVLGMSVTISGELVLPGLLSYVLRDSPPPDI